MLRIEDNDPISLGKTIKKLYPNMPVILLAFDETEIKQLSQKILKEIKSINVGEITKTIDVPSGFLILKI